jgi:hypothetical protein
MPALPALPAICLWGQQAQHGATTPAKWYCEGGVLMLAFRLVDDDDGASMSVLIMCRCRMKSAHDD